jgi:hypothetical protein
VFRKKADGAADDFEKGKSKQDNQQHKVHAIDIM